MNASILRELLTYDPCTGAFHWRVSRRCVRAGDLAGTVQRNGYVAIKIAGRLYSSHRLAWLYMTGEWPAAEIDHKNRDRADNTWLNLREATGSQNRANRPSPVRDLPRGVTADKDGRFRARVKVGRKERHLGRFDTAEAASLAYRSAATEAFGPYFGG